MSLPVGSNEMQCKMPGSWCLVSVGIYYLVILVQTLYLPCRGKFAKLQKLAEFCGDAPETQALKRRCIRQMAAELGMDMDGSDLGNGYIFDSNTTYSSSSGKYSLEV